MAVPVIDIAEPSDSGAALRDALARLGAGDWLVLTSPNGAAAVATLGPIAEEVKVAVIGPGTARQAATLGITPSLVAEHSIAEGLLDVFPKPARPGGTVVLARAATARAVLPDGLRRAGWNVIDVAAYRTVGVSLTREQRRAAAAANGVVFTSSSTVRRLAEEIGVESVPPLVVSIGPATSATARALGLEISIEATKHTIDGLIAAISQFCKPLTDSGEMRPAIGTEAPELASQE